MATSGSIDYARTRDNLIDTSLKLLGVLGEGETASANAVTDMAVLLNSMIKSWQAKGINLWREDEAVVFLTDAVNTYTLSSSDDRASAEIIKTELSAAGTTGATTISVDAVTNMATSDQIGVELDDNTIDWSTISSIDSSALTVTMAAGLGGAAAVDNNVYVYTTKLARPLDILSVRILYDSGTELELQQLGRREYFQLPNKTQAGRPVAYYYSPQLTNGKLYVWPTPDDVADRLRITYIRTIEDFDAAGDNPDLPQEWLEALAFNLAVRAAPMYGINLLKSNPNLLQLATMTYQDLLAYDSETSSIYIIPRSEE